MVTSLITSQIDAAPKLEAVDPRLELGLITSQIDAAPKLMIIPIIFRQFDYQSDRRCSKTIGAKSPLQRTFKSDWKGTLALDKVQVNRSFLLVFILISVLLVLNKQNLCF